MPRLTQAKLKETLHYDPETGIFTRKIGGKGTRGKGLIAGTLKKTGYRQMMIDGKIYLAHRLAWLYMEGYMPENIDIDHIDRNPSNNKFQNLRLVSRRCNRRNCGNPASNTSGIKGVYWFKRDKNWKAGIRIGTNRHIGMYKDFDEAVCARLAAEQCVGWEGCDSHSPAYQYVQKMLKESK